MLLSGLKLMNSMTRLPCKYTPATHSSGSPGNRMGAQSRWESRLPWVRELFPLVAVLSLLPGKSSSRNQFRALLGGLAGSL